MLVFFPTRSDRWNFFFCNATCEESSRDCDRERGEASGNGQAMHVIKHLKGKMIDSFGYRGFPIRGACGRLCPNSMSATEIEISPARHGLMSGHKSLPCLGFPSGHALPQPLWMRCQVVDQLSANFIWRLYGVWILWTKVEEILHQSKKVLYCNCCNFHLSNAPNLQHLTAHYFYSLSLICKHVLFMITSLL